MGDVGGEDCVPVATIDEKDIFGLSMMGAIDAGASG